MEMRRPRPDMPSAEKRKKARERSAELQSLQEELGELQYDLEQAEMMGDKKRAAQIRSQIEMTKGAMEGETPVMPKLEKPVDFSIESTKPTLADPLRVERDRKRKAMIRSAIEGVEADEAITLEKIKPTAEEFADASIMREKGGEATDLRGTFAAREREDRQKRLAEIMARVDKAFEEKMAQVPNETEETEELSGEEKVA